MRYFKGGGATLRVFEIWKEGSQKPGAEIIYDETRPETQRWSGRLLSPDNISGAPYLFAGWYERTGNVWLPDDLAFKWVRDRTMPPDRQGAGSVLKSLGLKFYSRADLLAVLDGRRADDPFFVREVEGSRHGLHR